MKVKYESESWKILKEKVEYPSPILRYYKVGTSPSLYLFKNKTYQIDSNVIIYINNLMMGKMLIDSPIYNQLRKLSFLVSKFHNSLDPIFGAWENSSIKEQGGFPLSELKEQLLIDCLANVLKFQTLSEQPVLSKSLEVDSIKTEFLLNRYQAKSYSEAAVNFLDKMRFFSFKEQIKYIINEKIESHAKYLRICYQVHQESHRNKLKQSKIEVFLDNLEKERIPMVPKTFNFCIYLLSNTIATLKYGTLVKAFEAIQPQNIKNTAIDFFFGDFAHLSNDFVVDDIANDIRFVSADNLSLLVEENITTSMFKNDGDLLPSRFDYARDWNFLKKADRKAVEEYLKQFLYYPS